jgi:hypothetical protein
MIHPINSANIQAKINRAIREKQVEPFTVLNRMCLGFVNNDWLTVASSVLKLSVFALLMCFSRSV